MSELHLGDTVTILPKYQDEGDESIQFTVIEIQCAERVTIQAELGLPINPTMICPAAWLKKA